VVEGHAQGDPGAAIVSRDSEALEPNAPITSSWSWAIVRFEYAA
jgi:hypothetical protein